MNNMDLIREVVSTPYAFPAGIVALVISCAILVFVFGFKSAEEPPFDQLSFANDDRKPAGKKRKLKDKKSQSNGHATSVKDKTTKPSAEVESPKTSKQTPKQQPKEVQKEQTKKKEPAPQQQKEKVASNKKPSTTAPKQTTPKKSTQEAQKKAKKQEKVDDGDGWEQVGKKNRKGTPPVIQDDKEKSTSTSPTKEKKGKKAVEAEKTTPAVEVKDSSPKGIKEKVVVEVKETSPKVSKDKAPAPVVEKAAAVKDIPNDSPKKAPLTKDNSKSPEKKAAPAKVVEPEPQPSEFKTEEKKEKKKKPAEPEPQPEFKVEEKKEKKKKPAESASFIESEKSAIKDEGKVAVQDNKVDGAVFDELGDVWTEKTAKKGKKKVRKE
ncbi:hypothetical protein FOCC_FOCC006029 [Frankliniella occidentalis]|nr:hypothetical protein FOCC_FOCC006029 [Frankliniella occidentalis]